MAKRSGSKSESKRLQKIEQENEKLRKEVSRLRKQSRSNFVDSMEEKANRIKEQPVKLPTCETCGNNDISIISVERKDGTFKMKVCKSCRAKSPMKRSKV